jgi:hypothetical protein
MLMAKLTKAVQIALRGNPQNPLFAGFWWAVSLAAVVFA